MDKKIQLYQKAKTSPQSITFSEIKKLAKHFGFQFDRKNGSHEMFKRLDDPYGFMDFQPREGDKRMAKIYQVRQLTSFIDSKNLINDGADNGE
ncbi:MAG: hypothetical protein GQ559_11560 [Desulfobulbaceae bacterium]|nr:hypothetical protein [Desulfobulbaceae bacterium]